MPANRSPSSSCKPFFSVIIPCWNAGSTVAQTLASLQAQTCENWEAIVIDDGSIDETPEILKGYASADARFRILRTNRLGPSAARNLAALQVAQGCLIAFLDADDLWRPEKLTASLAHFENHPTIVGCYGQISFFKCIPDQPETYSTVYPNALTAADFLRDNPVCTMSNLVLRADAFRTVGGFNETIVHNEDVELLVRIAIAGGTILGINRHLVCYRTSVTGLSADITRMRQGWYKALETLQASAFALTPGEVAAADAGNLRYLARRALRVGAPGREALRLAWRGFLRAPRSFLNPIWRGGLTLIGATIYPALPTTFRKHIFSR